MYTAKEFLALPPDHFKGEPLRCGLCHGIADHEYDTEPHRIEDKIVCSDCYYDELSKAIEQYPIGLPAGEAKRNWVPPSFDDNQHRDHLEPLKPEEDG